MTWADFQTTVLAYINRQSADIPTIGSVNLVVVAANMAKNEAQRRHHFKMARVDALISTSVNGADLSTATLVDGVTAVVLKKVEAAWLYTTSGANKVRYAKIPPTTLGSLNREYVASSITDVNNPPVVNPSPYPPYGNINLYWYIKGTAIYLGGAATSTSILLDAIKWMPDYDGSITDFFLTYHTDWMLYKTVDNLQRYLKEDQRVMISQTDLEKRWTSVVNFDENYSDDNFDAGSSD